MSNVVQNVNLYLPEFRRKKHWLDAEKMVALTGVALVLLIAASAFDYWQLAQKRAELAETERQQQQARAATTALLEQFGVQTQDASLLARIEEMEANLQSKQTLLQFLEGRQLGNARGFSEHLSDLSRYHVQGLSLSSIKLSEGGASLELAGQMLRAELVPLYLQNLSQGSAFIGKDFEMLNIQDGLNGSGPDATIDGRPVWNFEVRSLQTSTRSASTP